MTTVLQTYDDKSLSLTDEQVNKLKPVLLQTGKFIEVNGNIINISSIKSITKSKTKEDYDITKVKL